MEKWQWIPKDRLALPTEAVLQLCAGLGAAWPLQGLTIAKGRAVSGTPEEASCQFPCMTAF